MSKNHLAILEETHYAVLDTIHNTLQKEAQRYSTVLQHGSYTDYFHEDTPIMSLDTEQYLDNIQYYSRLKLETEKNDNPYISIVLTTEANFPPLYTRCMAWNLRGQYDFSWKSVKEIMENVSYSTKWTITYESPRLSFCYEEMDEPNQVFQEEYDNHDTAALEEARRTIDQLLKPPTFT